MGAKQSELTDEQMDEYVLLTHFSSREIKRLYDRFRKAANVSNPYDQRIPANTIIEAFPQLKFNPFRERLSVVFSSRRDHRFSFDDFLDLVGAFDEKTPFDVKAAFAFQVFDYDDDQLLNTVDVAKIVYAFTSGSSHPDQLLDQNDLNEIVHLVLEEAGTNGVDTISLLEFQQLLQKLPDFPMSFRFHL